MTHGDDASLWRLIEERTRPGADVADIDRRIWDQFGETSAVLFTDLAGFSRQVDSFGIIHFLQIIHDKKKLLLPILAGDGGVLIKSEADSFLVVFGTAAAAIECAVKMQRACQRASARRAPEEQILLCVGIGYGPILRIGDFDVWGREVNAASKLGEDTARAHEILITGPAREHAAEVDGVTYEPFEEAVAGVGSCFRVRYPSA